MGFPGLTCYTGDESSSEARWYLPDGGKVKSSISTARGFVGVKQSNGPGITLHRKSYTVSSLGLFCCVSSSAKLCAFLGESVTL